MDSFFNFLITIPIDLLALICKEFLLSSTWIKFSKEKCDPRDAEYCLVTSSIEGDKPYTSASVIHCSLKSVQANLESQASIQHNFNDNDAIANEASPMLSSTSWPTPGSNYDSVKGDGEYIIAVEIIHQTNEQRVRLYASSHSAIPFQLQLVPLLPPNFGRFTTDQKQGHYCSTYLEYSIEREILRTLYGTNEPVKPLDCENEEENNNEDINRDDTNSNNNRENISRWSYFGKFGSRCRYRMRAFWKVLCGITFGAPILIVLWFFDDAPESNYIAWLIVIAMYIWLYYRLGISESRRYLGLKLFGDQSQHPNQKYVDLEWISQSDFDTSATHSATSYGSFYDNKANIHKKTSGTLIFGEKIKLKAGSIVPCDLLLIRGSVLVQADLDSEARTIIAIKNYGHSDDSVLNSSTLNEKESKAIKYSP